MLSIPDMTAEEQHLNKFKLFISNIIYILWQYENNCFEGGRLKTSKRSWTRNAKHLAIWSLNPFDQICPPRIAISIVPAIVLLRATLSVTNLALQQLMQQFYKPSLVPLCSTNIRSEIQIWLFVKTSYNMHNHLQWIYQANFIHSVSIKVDNVLNVFKKILSIW